MSQDPQDERRLLDLMRRIRSETRAAEAEGEVTLPRALLSELVRRIYAPLVDEEWYLARYPDIADAVEREVVANARTHYVQSGIYEGRMPYRLRLDSAEYLRAYPDVLTAIREGEFRSALDHFVQAGFGEGRAFRLAPLEPAAEAPAQPAPEAPPQTSPQTPSEP